MESDSHNQYLGHRPDDSVVDVDIVAKRLFGEISPSPKIGRFTVLEVLGSGGMGAVYAAQDPDADRMVAIKVVNAVSSSGDPSDSHARLVREARITSRVLHPNIVTVHEHGIHEGRVFVVMDLISGLPLDRWLSVELRVWTEVFELLLGAGEGLAAAHAAGVVHRDFKPANVLVDASGHPRVIDFGLGRPIDSQSFTAGVGIPMRSFHYSITGPGKVSGTPSYMAPELFAGARPAPQADIYAFCITALEASRAVSTQREPGITGEIVDVLLRGIDPDPAKRWQQMRELLDELRRCIGGRRRRFDFLRALVRTKWRV